jgi:hypothetical protein
MNPTVALPGSMTWMGIRLSSGSRCPQSPKGLPPHLLNRKEAGKVLCLNQYQDMRSLRRFEALAVEGDVDTTVTEKSQTALALASMVSGSYFSMLGVRAEVGPVLALADEQPATLGLELPPT